MSDLNLQTASPPKVAIVGSGPGGLAAAKFLKQHGFEPVLFEQNDAIGGHQTLAQRYSGTESSILR